LLSSPSSSMSESGTWASSSPRPSRETGKDTDFVVVVSDEPEGALKI
jgi:hypothetical protein